MSTPTRWCCAPKVLVEFNVTVTRKLTRPLDEATAAAQLEELARGTVVGVDAELVRSAAHLSRAHRPSLWDAMIVRAAVRAGCDTVITEDLAHGAVLDDIRFHDPFLASDT
jgi:predicted nucleic acid-binding protein